MRIIHLLTVSVVRFVDRCSFSLQIKDSMRNAQETFQMEVHAARVVPSADSLLKLVSGLKQSAVFSDFLSLNRSINQRIRKFREQSQDAKKLLVNTADEAATSLHELESHYYASPYRTLEADAEMFQRSSNDFRD